MTLGVSIMVCPFISCNARPGSTTFSSHYLLGPGHVISTGPLNAFTHPGWAKVNPNMWCAETVTQPVAGQSISPAWFFACPWPMTSAYAEGVGCYTSSSMHLDGLSVCQSTGIKHVWCTSPAPCIWYFKRNAETIQFSVNHSSSIIYIFFLNRCDLFHNVGQKHHGSCSWRGDCSSTQEGRWMTYCKGTEMMQGRICKTNSDQQCSTVFPMTFKIALSKSEDLGRYKMFIIELHLALLCKWCYR